MSDLVPILIRSLFYMHRKANTMTLLRPATGGGYLKAGFLGFAKSGKTHTATELAIGTRQFFKLTGPIAMYDTEGGSDYWSSRVKKATGSDLLVVKSRSLVDLVETAKECIASGVSVLVVDSVTHVWREVCDAYLVELQAAAEKKGWRRPDRLEFQDWSRIKMKWATWPDLYLNAPLHIIVCGRAGYEYDMETNERGKKELVKTGVKMKVEAEFGFEPSILVEMERDWTRDEPPKMINRATVIGDRFDRMNGRSTEQPTFEFFRPFVELLAPAQHTPVATDTKTEFGLDEAGLDSRDRDRRSRQILCEEIEGLLTSKWPGQSAADKKAKADAVQKHLGTRSWKAVEGMHPDRLGAALEAMRVEIEPADDVVF